MLSPSKRNFAEENKSILLLVGSIDTKLIFGTQSELFPLNQFFSEIKLIWLKSFFSSQSDLSIRKMNYFLILPFYFSGSSL